MPQPRTYLKPKCEIFWTLPLTSRPILRRGLYLVLTNPAAGYEALTEMAVEANLSAVQFRPKAAPGQTLDAGELLRMARVLRDTTRGSSTLFIVNDRPDLAVESG